MQRYFILFDYCSKTDLPENDVTDEVLAGLTVE
jgi:hypothetical protein